MKSASRKISYIAIWLILLAQLLTLNGTRIWEHEKRVIYWDVLEYYSYLPATFIYGDVTLGFMSDTTVNWNSKFWPKQAPNNGRVIKMTMGMAFMYSPFFFTAHGISKIFNLEADGYSIPYRISLILSCLFYLIISLFLLRKLLLRWFNDVVTALTLLLVVCGTNLFYYSSIEPVMSHAYNFSLFVFFIYLSMSWYNNQSLKNSILLGLVTGLIVLIRPTNILILLFFLLYKVEKPADLGVRIRFLIKKYLQLVLIAICMFLIIFPQLLYWKMVTGSWLYYSYGEEGFFFSNPQIIPGLFSYRKGWLLYTPVMLFALAGIVFLYFRLKEFFYPVLIFIVADIYVIFSWWTWWYGGGFGARPMIESYALLAFPLATFLSFFWQKRLYSKIITIILVCVFIFHSLFQTSQYYYGSIHWDSMSKKSYWLSFGHLKPQPGFYKLLENPDYEKALKGIQDIKPKE